MDEIRIEKKEVKKEKPKFWKRRVGILGKQIPVVVLLLVAVGIASAALVNYLSNEVDATVTVDSPMKLRISGTDTGEWTTTTLVIGDMYGGENTTFYTREKNLADVVITGNVSAIVTSSLINCSDFESVIVSTSTNGAPYGTEHELMGFCEWVNESNIKFNYPGPISWSPGQVDINKIVVTFEQHAKGNYTFTNQIV